MNTVPVTVVVPILNEAANLPACLDALARFDDIIVIDSGSTDGSAELVRERGHQLLQFDWDGRFPKKRNWYLINHKPRYKWVLFLDADEVVTPDFVRELENEIASTSAVGFWLRYTNYFQGQALRYGVQQRKLALLRHGAGLYERIDEARWSELDMEVHEHPQLNGEIGEIRAPIDHRDHNGLARFIRKHLDYAQWEVGRLSRLRADEWAWSALTRRQRLKYGFILTWWFAPTYFVVTFFIGRGFLDGVAGYRYARMKQWYFAIVRQLAVEGRSRRARS